MLVRHNLSSYTNYAKSPINVYNNSCTLDIDGDIITSTSLKDEYSIVFLSFGATSLAQDEPITITGELENLNGTEMTVRTIGMRASSGDIVSNKKEKIKWEIKGLRNLAYNLQIQVKSENKETMKYRLKNIMITSGNKSDVFLPPNKDLPQDKIPPQGEYKEIYPI